MIMPAFTHGQKAAAWAGAGVIGLAADAAGGAGFLGQEVAVPLWALLPIFALPMEAIVAMVMRVSGSKRYGPDEPKAEEDRVGS